MTWHDFERGCRLWAGDALDMLSSLPDNSCSGAVSDPPYGLNFMGSKWDLELPDPAIWCELHRVLKPGAWVVIFSSTRTLHRLGCQLEDAGFEPRDLIGWLQFMGFPKSQDCSKALDKAAGAERKTLGSKIVTRDFKGSSWTDLHCEPNSATTVPVTAPATELAELWQGYGTALKPALEPAFLMRKRPAGTMAANITEHQCGGLNIDGCRHNPGDPAWVGPNDDHAHWWDDLKRTNIGAGGDFVAGSTQQDFDLTGYKPSGRWPSNTYQCPKVSRSEREQYTEGFAAVSGSEAVKRKAGSAGLKSPRAGASRTADQVRNRHPTVKPRALMRWLLRLVTPPESVAAPILDPFLGSGTTMLAGLDEGIKVWGSELQPEYQDLIRHRMQKATQQGWLF